MILQTVLFRLANPRFDVVTMSKFKNDLRNSSADNPIKIEWSADSTGKSYRFMYWDEMAYTGNEASQTREDNGEVALYSLDDNDYRTINYATVTRYRFNNTTYIVK